MRAKWIMLILIGSIRFATAQQNNTQPKSLTIPLKNNQTIEFIWIEPGPFLMGSPASDPLADDNEKPQKQIRIENGFYLGRTTVTFSQFQEFALEEGYLTDAEKELRPAWRGGHGFNTDKHKFEGLFPQYTWRNPGWTQLANYPVGNVSWNDATKFCEWLSKKSGKLVRLPTEAEWEYACRAGSTNRFFTGDDPLSLKGYANVPDEALRVKLGEPASNGLFGFNDGYAFTAPVGQFNANAWGLQDMLGNVFEWCADEIAEPTPPKRVLRGGSYNLNIQTCRCAYRGFSKPDGRYSYTGFRVVVMP
ncbi:formylglycine-generating enzyme family protein [Spirosoma sp. BT702]|uniref:Formylglycine-generating enzyme family protein n=1 Tax=Spirosoma profusum TaxID=2771354 RepID=A0A927AWR6_9BACT|nr:formylglycine-generating enzyme family protein [Spirosoma profusum]MBD2705875.1 formylglycine-generating enzyme family protein [Spirosoma profusum]